MSKGSIDLLSHASTSQRLLSTPRFAVDRRVFARPDGSEITREVVVHPGAVVILPLLPDGRIVLIRNFRPTVEEELLELPAGTREPGEQPLTTAQRELEEETGYRAESWSLLAEFYTSPGILTEKMFAYMATGLTHVGQRLDESEEIVVTPLAKEDVLARLMRGEFRDGKTMATLGIYFLAQAKVTGVER
jgi:ADP-ribose pyrophosphatase